MEARARHGGPGGPWALPRRRRLGTAPPPGCWCGYPQVRMPPRCRCPAGVWDAPKCGCPPGERPPGAGVPPASGTPPGAGAPLVSVPQVQVSRPGSRTPPGAGAPWSGAPRQVQVPPGAGPPVAVPQVPRVPGHLQGLHPGLRRGPAADRAWRPAWSARSGKVPCPPFSPPFQCSASSCAPLTLITNSGPGQLF